MEVSCLSLHSLPSHSPIVLSSLWSSFSLSRSKSLMKVSTLRLPTASIKHFVSNRGLFRSFHYIPFTPLPLFPTQCFLDSSSVEPQPHPFAFPFTRFIPVPSTSLASSKQKYVVFVCRGSTIFISIYFFPFIRSSFPIIRKLIKMVFASPNILLLNSRLL